MSECALCFTEVTDGRSASCSDMCGAHLICHQCWHAHLDQELLEKRKVPSFASRPHCWHARPTRAARRAFWSSPAPGTRVSVSYPSASARLAASVDRC